MYPIARAALGVFSLAVAYHELDRMAGIKTTPYNPEDFADKSVGAPAVKWNNENSVAAVEQFAKNPEQIMQFVEAASEKSSSIDGYGITDFRIKMPGHAYVHVGNTLPVPSIFTPLFLDISSFLPMRGLLSMFPPFGGEVPKVSRIARYLDDDTYGSLNPNEEAEDDRKIIDYRKSRTANNLPLEGVIGLGNVFVKASGATIIANERFVVRHVMMSTSELHALDGRALWILAYDKQKNTTMFCAVGAGSNSLPFIDKMNNHTAGLVFSVMHNSFSRMMQIAEQQGGVQRITDGIATVGWSTTGQIAQSDKLLMSRRVLAGSFDMFSRLIALARLAEGMDVVDIPDDENDLQHAVSLFKQHEDRM